ncbi:MAG: hypothetical protein KBF32_02060 [Chitinophagales bacterium]|nr:hypothetical protein [Chitinophagales bacterium]
MKLKEIPTLLHADSNGKIFDDPDLHMSGRSGFDAVALDTDDFIALPEGSDLLELPGRKPIGFDKKTGVLTVIDKGIAVATQMAPAHTQLYLSSYVKEKKMLLPFRLLHIQLLDGLMENIMCRQFALMQTSGN